MKKRRSTSTSVSFFAFQDIITSVVGIFVLITLIMAIELAQSVSDASQATNEGVSQDLLNAIVSLEESVQQMQAEYDAMSSTQSAVIGLNRFNREQELMNAEIKLSQAQQRTVRVEQDLQDIQQSLVDAKKLEEQLIADGKAAEADRAELDTLQKKRKKTEHYSALLQTENPMVFRDQTEENRFVVLVRLERGKISVSDSADRTKSHFAGSACVQEFTAWLSTTGVSTRQFLLIVTPDGVDDFEGVRSSLDAAGATWGFDVATSDQNFSLRYEMEVHP